MSTAGTYNIFGELAKWSKVLAPWQQAALLILVTKKEINEDDFEIIFREFSIDQGLVKPPTDRAIYSFESSEIPKVEAGQKPIKLKSIQKVRGVNALAQDQELPMGDNLTVIYGPNGTGKSGYARLLKSACFTRSKEREIHGNIHLALDERPSPSAEFLLDNGNTEKYQDGKSCGPLIDHFAVFDSSCIRIYTDEKNEFNVSPYGFDVFPGLIDASDRIRIRLQKEIDKRRPELAQFQIEASNSQVAKLLGNLQADSKLGDLKTLSVFGEDEQNELEKLQKSLQELIQQDPATLIKQKKRQAADLALLAKKLEAIEIQLSQNVLESLEIDINEFKKLEEVAKASSAAQFGSEPVQPIGTAAWTALLKAAISYNVEAYPGAEFPPIASDAKCLLCHQSLDNEGARNRLLRFYRFITSDTEQKIKTMSERLDSIHKNIQAIKFDFIPQDSSIFRTLEDLNKALLGRVQAIIRETVARRKLVSICIDKKEYSQIQPLSLVEVLAPISKIEQRLTDEVADLAKKDVGTLKDKLTGPIQLFDDRKKLNKIYPSVETAVANLQWITKAEQGAKSLNKKSITNKQKSLITELIAKGYIDTFIRECAGLNFKLPINVKISGADGTTQRKMVMGVKAGSAPSPSKVLSEGEQTAVALADFLTEVRLDQRPLGIIFDDPVNSMDHLRKELIAHRLVVEAKDRQVIIFTHDIVFTSHLAKAAETEKVKFAGRTVSLGYEDGLPGYIGYSVFPNSYYEGKGAADAESMVPEAKKLKGKEATEKLKLGCGMLRTAYEDFIQRHVFNDAINRWREELKPFALANMYYDEELISKMSEQMGRLSRHIEAHSHTPEYAEEPLTPDLLQGFIDEYRIITKEYRKKADTFRKQKSKDKKEIYE